MQRALTIEAESHADAAIAPAQAPRMPQLDPHRIWSQKGRGADKVADKAADTGVDKTGLNAPSLDALPKLSIDAIGDATHALETASHLERTAMADPHFSSLPDDDLPRTFRRERDARQRSAQQAMAVGSGTGLDTAPGEGPPVTVTAIEMPFFRLMGFFLKAVVAAIPALILLGLVLFAMGKLAQIFLPWLVKMNIVITFP